MARAERVEGDKQTNKTNPSCTQKNKQTNKKSPVRLLLRDFVLSRHIKMFPSAVQKNAGVAQKGEQSCLCQPNNCRLGAATPRPSKRCGRSWQISATLSNGERQETRNCSSLFYFIFYSFFGAGGRVQNSGHCWWAGDVISQGRWNVVEKFSGFPIWCESVFGGNRTVEGKEVTFRE